MISFYKPDYSKNPFVRKRIDEPKNNREKTETPQVSIITAFYNTGEVFWDTFYSIVNQTFSDFEWLIVNDGSVQNDSLGILSQVEAMDDRIRVINNPCNLGLGLTRNNGVKHAKSPYLFFIDSDDMVEFSFLEKCILCLKLNTHFSFVGSYTIGFGPKKYLWKYGFIPPLNFFDENYAVNCFVCKKSVFTQVQYNGDRGGMEDWDFWLNAASNGMWGYTIPEFLYWYRERENRVEDWPNFQEENKKVIKKKYAEKYKSKVAKYTYDLSFSKTPSSLTCREPRASSNDNVLFVFDYCMNKSQNKLIKDYIQLFRKNGSFVSIVINALEDCEYNGEFKDITDDVFILSHLAESSKHHQVLQYLISTRGIGRVLAINFNTSLFFAAYLKTIFSQLQFDILVISISKDRSVNEWVVLYNLDTPLINTVGVSSNDIKFHLEANTALYGKTFFVPPLITDSSNKIVSLNYKQAKRNEFGISPSTFTISFTGEVAFSSKFYSLHHIVTQINRAGYQNFQFIFLAWGEAVHDLRNYVFDKHIQEKVWIFQTTPDDARMEDIIAMSDMYLDMPEMNGFNDGLRTAICDGIPIVSIGNHLMKDIINSNTGFSFCADISQNETPIAEFISRHIITLIESPLQKNKFRENGITKARTFFHANHPSVTKFIKLKKAEEEIVTQKNQVEMLTRSLLTVSNS